MIIIAAMSRNRVIGVGEGMPWHVPEEYQHFLDTIRGHTVVMGRRSFEIFGPDLTSAHNIVVSTRGGKFPNAVVAANLETALELAETFGQEVFVAGGAMVYEQAIQRAERMYLSFIQGEYHGDAYFPAFTKAEWDVVRREDRRTYEFVEYRRRRQ